MSAAKLASKEKGAGTTIVNLSNDVSCGGKEILIIGGPCTVESVEQMETVAARLSGSSIQALRGGAHKPRTSPYAFQGLGLQGLQILSSIKERFSLPVVTEVMSCEQIADVAAHADVLQIGSRNMQNYELLKSVGQAGKPVLLKRGLSATLEEFILAAEYILSQGNPNVILCERGIRSFDSYTRNVLDLGAVVALKQLTHLPVIVDPSHAAGKAELVADLARAAIACGADGLIIECHPEPDKSVSDARQALSLPDMVALVESLRPIAAAVGRRVAEKNQPQLSIISTADQSNLEKTDQTIAAAVALKDIRANIDELDNTMSLLLSKRFSLARQLKSIKAQLQLPVCDSNRELAVLNNVAAAGTDSPMAEAIKNVWKTVIAQSRFLQAPEPQREAQSTTMSQATSISSKYCLPWRRRSAK